MGDFSIELLLASGLGESWSVALNDTLGRRPALPRLGSVAEELS